MSVLKLLKHSFLFGECSESELNAISKKFLLTHINKGEVLISEGDVGEDVFFIEDGCFYVFKRNGSENVKIGSLVSGDIVGEMAVLSNEKRNSTIIATRTSVVHSLKKNDFLELVNEYPSILLKITKLIIERNAIASHSNQPKSQNDNQQTSVTQ